MATAATKGKAKPKVKVSAPTQVPLSEIVDDLRPASQMRVALDTEAVKAYAERLNELPPVKLVRDYQTGRYWLADGCHTVTASRQAGRTKIRAVAIDGNYLDAFKLACAANDTHGVRVTNADKRRRIEEALRNPEIASWSNRRIAEFCGVDDKTVGRLRPEPTAEIPQLDTPQESPPEETSSEEIPRVGPPADVPAEKPPTAEIPQLKRVGRDGKERPVKSLRRAVVRDEYAQDVPDYEDCSQDEDDGPARDDDDSDAPPPLPQRPSARSLASLPGRNSAPLANPVPALPVRPSLVELCAGFRRSAEATAPGFASAFADLSDADKARVAADVEALADLFDGWSGLIRGGTD